jgi:hypothetical protein
MLECAKCYTRKEEHGDTKEENSFDYLPYVLRGNIMPKHRLEDWFYINCTLHKANPQAIIFLVQTSTLFRTCLHALFDRFGEHNLQTFVACHS